ncbi:MAG: hypothetical protein OQJ99_02770 [Rhodospirillales bacterium]|nr:hypothetical protein [Rhodospirillales bacterium]MCW8862790.1 hypothetical protein [Rhodospirillales bacterium]MCW8953203.1 hypothetical protein [Rhodospirillales bacterium]MCW8969816.1 hypothetical protein [Rhodospirillales bacterium]MCW9040222.1 hypothetical protein [Rhodospirillales bacterium]
MAENTNTRRIDRIPPSDGLREAVADVLPRVTVRTFSVESEGRTLWIKRPAAHKGNRWHGVQKALAVVMMEPLLTPTLPLSGAAGLAAEAKRLRTLAAAGVRVPEVVAETADWIALGDLGQPLEWALDGIEDERARSRLLDEAADALSALHRSGLWHGAPFVRNMAVGDGKIGFFDVEETVEGSMPDTAGMARDFILFLFSATRYLSDADLLVLARRYATSAPEGVLLPLLGLGRKAAVLAFFLRPFSGRLGRDLRQGLTTVDTLRALLAVR